MAKLKSRYIPEFYGFFKTNFPKEHNRILKEFFKTREGSKILSVRVPSHLKARLQDEKNPSKIVRQLLEKHFKEMRT